MNEIKRAAVVRYYGSVKAAAIALEVDPSQMQREFKAGDFARVESHDEDGACLAAIAAAMQEEFGHLATTPELRVLKVLHAIRLGLEEFEQYVEFKARERGAA